MDADKPSQGRPSEVEPWEIDLISKFADRVERSDPGGLLSDLAFKWLQFKRRYPGTQRSSAYLAGFLENKLRNWRRDRRRREQRLVRLDPWNPEDGFGESQLPATEGETPDEDRRVAFRKIREKLKPQVRRLFDIIGQRKITQVALGKWLRKHPNTIRAWLKQIYAEVAAHASFLGQLRPTVPIPRRSGRHERTRVAEFKYIPVPFHFLDALIRMNLSGTQFRVIFKILVESSRQKQRAIRFTWYSMATELGLDRRGVSRAARDLIGRGLIFLDGRKIGLTSQSPPTARPASDKARR